MNDMGEIRKIAAQNDKRNMDQLEALMFNIVRIYKTNMENNTKKGLDSLELKFNLEFKESFEPAFVKRYEETKVIIDFVKECNNHNVKIKMKLKGLETLIIKANW